MTMTIVFGEGVLSGDATYVVPGEGTSECPDILWTFSFTGTRTG